MIHNTLATSDYKPDNVLGGIIIDTKQLHHQILDLEKQIAEEEISFELDKNKIRERIWAETAEKPENTDFKTNGLGLTLPLKSGDEKLDVKNITPSQMHSILEKNYNLINILTQSNK